MAKKHKIIKTTKSSALKITHPDTAGIDIGKDLMQVSVPADRCADSNRCFKTFTSDLREIVKWLQSCGIKRVAMESTGVYWVNIFLMLQESGFETLLVNAKSIKNISGRKSDASDADWLRFLGSCNLLRPCYQSDSVSRRLRQYSRLRNTKVKDAARELNRMQKAMEQMNIKLTSVISDIAGDTGMNIIRAIVNGERNPDTLSSLASGKCKKNRGEIARSLEGTWDPEHLFSLKQSLEMYDFLKRQVEQCDVEMEAFLDSYDYTPTSDTSSKLLQRSEKVVNKKNRIGFDVEKCAFEMFGVNAMRIPGVGQGTLLILISELGPGFTNKFDTPAKFCHWCNLTPEDKVTGGDVKSSKIPKRKNLVGQAFRQCAMTLQRKDAPLGHYFRRIKSRLGTAQATVATAHKIAEIFYLMVNRQEEYNERITAENEAAILNRKIANLEKTAQKLKDKLLELNAPSVDDSLVI